MIHFITDKNLPQKTTVTKSGNHTRNILPNCFLFLQHLGHRAQAVFGKFLKPVCNTFPPKNIKGEKEYKRYINKVRNLLIMQMYRVRNVKFATCENTNTCTINELW